MLEGLFTTVTNVNFNDETIQELIDKVNNLKLEITKNNNTTPCPNYDLTTLWHANEDIRSLKSLILFGIRGMAAYAYHAMVLGYKEKEVTDFLTTWT